MIKRMILVMAIALVMVAMLAVPAAFAQGNSEAAHFCRAIAGTPPSFPPGECVSDFAHNK